MYIFIREIGKEERLIRDAAAIGFDKGLICLYRDGKEDEYLSSGDFATVMVVNEG